MSNAIVVVNVSQTLAPAPSKLQETGAFVTQGGTTTAAGTLTLLPNMAALTAILAPAVAINAIAWSSSVATITTAAPHGWGVGDVIPIVVAGATPSGYNGHFTGTVTGASTVTYPLVSNPGSETVPGTVKLGASEQLNAMGNTFFSQPGNQSVYVLELGEGNAAAGPPALTTFINNNLLKVYSWLVPREWDNLSGFLTLAGSKTAPNAMTYFFVTTTVANRAVYAGLKCVFAEVEAPGIPVTEFSLAAAFSVTLNYAPSSTNKVPPLSYAFVYGVTPYPLPGNQTIFTELNAANVGWIGTGAEGGISLNVLFYGQLSDGNPFNFWYSADWAQINIDLNLSNEVINGSNDPIAPLYYNQQGIDRLQNRAAQTIGTAVTNGLALGRVKTTKLPAQDFINNFEAGLYQGFLVINAEPFNIYAQENPNDYAVGTYGGLACVYTPLRGFKQIIFDLNVTNIVA